MPVTDNLKGDNVYFGSGLQRCQSVGRVEQTTSQRLGSSKMGIWEEAMEGYMLENTCPVIYFLGPTSQ